MKAIRYISFILAITITIIIINTIIPLLFFSMLNFERGWLILLLVIFSIISAAYHALPQITSYYVSKISPSKYFAAYATTIIGTIISSEQIYSYWNDPSINKDGIGILIGIILTCILLGITSALSLGAGYESNEENLIITLAYSFGTIIFYLGIGLLFCLISAKVCEIEQTKSYNWYSGIWHGIFTAPKWVISWFIDVQFKAQNSTVMYSIYWWISCVIINLGLFGIGLEKLGLKNKSN